MRHKFLKYLYLIVLVGFIFLVNTCALDNQGEDIASKTVLIYISADSSLSDYVDNNFNQIKEGYHLVAGPSTNLLVYLEVEGRTSILYNVYNDSGKVKDRVVEEYAGTDSSSVGVMKDVFRDVYERYPASSYGLVLAFHGAGWLPENDLLASSIESKCRFPTRSLSVQKQVPFTDIKSILTALDSAPYMDFIVFDACLMGSVEVADELSMRANFMVASPTEVHIDGFPYDLLVKEMFVDGMLNYKAICEDYVESYIGRSGDDERYNTATMSAINLKYVEVFHQFVKRMMLKYSKQYDSLNPLLVQPFDRLAHKVFFDAQDLLLQLPLTSKEKEELEVIISSLVYFKSSTSYFLNLPIEKFCGISLGYMKYQMKDVKARYMDLNWVKSKKGSMDMFGW